jgi:hypothetical protein
LAGPVLAGAKWMFKQLAQSALQAVTPQMYCEVLCISKYLFIMASVLTKKAASGEKRPLL